MRAFASAIFAVAASFAASAQDTPPRPELEPDRVFVANDSAVMSELTRFHTSASDLNDEIIAELRGWDFDRLPPPWIMELGRRVAAEDAAEGVYLFWLGLYRMTTDAHSCADPRAGQLAQIVAQGFGQFEDFRAQTLNLEHRLAAHRRLRENGAVFVSEASAWWICSHAEPVFEGVAPRAQTLSDWRVDDERMTALRTQFETSLDEWIAQMEAESAAE